MVRAQPQDVAAESNILGAIMLEANALDVVVEILNADDFYSPANKIIYAACISLFSESQPIDITTVTAKVRKCGNLKNVGGAYYIADLTTRINSSANIEVHARIVAELSMRRKLITESSIVVDKSYDESVDIFELIGESDRKINSIVESKIRGSFQAVGDTITGVVESMYENKDKNITGVPSGFNELDNITGGFQNDDLIVIAARPAMGKTAFVVSAMTNIAKTYKKPVGMFSLEMSTNQLQKRMISSETQIDLQKIIKPKYIHDYEWDSINDRAKEISKMPIYIDDTSALSILELKTKAKKMVRDHNVEIIIVDYLQLMKGSSKGNREQEISSISSGLKGIAKDLSIPVIALSQLSRAVEVRGGDKRPLLSDLRESGSIEQDADIVMFLYRPEYYGIQEDEDGFPTSGEGQVIIAKHRNGSVQDVKLRFIGRFTKWDNKNETTSSLEKKQIFNLDTAEVFDMDKANEMLDKHDAPF